MTGLILFFKTRISFCFVFFYFFKCFHESPDCSSLGQMITVTCLYNPKCDLLTTALHCHFQKYALNMVHCSSLLLLWVPRSVRHLIQLTTRWQSVDSSTPSSPKCPEHTGIEQTIQQQNLTLTFSLTWLCTKYTWAILCSNIVFMVSHGPAQKSNNTVPLGFRSGRLNLPF